MTVLSYLIKMWGTKNQYLVAISRKVWKYLLTRKIAITTEYLQEPMNVEADRKSRKIRDSSKCKLNQEVLRILCQRRRTPEIDQLASRCHTNYHSTCLGIATLSARAGMLFRYPGLTSLLCFSPFYTLRKGSSESKSGSVYNAHKYLSMARPTVVSKASKHFCETHHFYLHSNIY